MEDLTVRADQPALSQDSGPILTVDEEEPLRRMCSQVLTAKGYEVQTAAHGEEALAVAAEMAYHVVLLDLKMPVMANSSACTTSGIRLSRRDRHDHEVWQWTVSPSDRSTDQL